MEFIEEARHIAFNWILNGVDAEEIADSFMAVANELLESDE